MGHPRGSAIEEEGGRTPTRKGRSPRGLPEERPAPSHERLERALAESEARYRLLVESTNVVLWEMDPATWLFTYVSPRAVELLGHPLEEWLGSGFWAEHIHPDDRQRVVRRRGEGARRLEDHELDYRMVAADDRVLWIRDVVSVIAEEERPVLMRGVMIDITQLKLAEEALQERANYDPLTHLPNRRLFDDRLSHALARAQRSRTLLALMYLDLDGFKEVNDSLGHGAGDEVLRIVAHRLRSRVRKSDTIARLGGNEFAIIASDCRKREDPETLARRVLELLTAPYVVDDGRAVLSASIGISFYPSDGANPDALLEKADRAMYRAKEAGRNTYRFFTPPTARGGPARPPSPVASS